MATFAVALVPLVGQISQAALGLMISVAFSTVQWAPTKAAIEAALAGDGDERAAVEARVNLAALLVAMVACYEVDFAAGIAIGVAVDVDHGARGARRGGRGAEFWMRSDTLSCPTSRHLWLAISPAQAAAVIRRLRVIAITDV